MLSVAVGHKSHLCAKFAAQQDCENMTFQTKQTSLHWMWYFRAQINARKSDMAYDSQGGRDKQQPVERFLVLSPPV